MRALTVPFFTRSDAFSRLWPIIRRHIVEVVGNGKYSRGRKVAEPERAPADRAGARHVPLNAVDRVCAEITDFGAGRTV